MSRIGGLERTRLPDFSIGATVLVVAIALPFFVFTRMEHAHRSAAQRPPATAASAQVRAVTTAPDPTAPVLSAPPQAASKAAPSVQPSAKPAAPPPSSVPTSAPTSTPTPTPTPAPDFAPVGVLTLSVSSVSSLTVTADASGSTDTDQTPIAKVIFNFGDGTTVTAQSGMTATHTYANPGTYTVSVAVIDTAHLSSTVSATVTVS